MSPDKIALPAQTVGIGDLMDRGMDKLYTVHQALCPDSKGYLDDAVMVSIWATLGQVLADLEPVRNRLQGVDDEDAANG